MLYMEDYQLRLEGFQHPVHTAERIPFPLPYKHQQIELDEAIS